MAQQAKEMEEQAKRIDEQIRTMEEQFRKLEELECYNRQSLLELRVDLEEHTKVNISEVWIEFQTKLESVKELVAVSANALNAPTTSAVELKSIQHQVDLTKARLDLQEVATRKLVSKSKMQELEVNTMLNALGKRISSIDDKQSTLANTPIDHNASEQVKAAIGSLQIQSKNYMKELEKNVNQRNEKPLRYIHHHINGLSSRLNNLYGEHDRVSHCLHSYYSH